MNHKVIALFAAVMLVAYHSSCAAGSKTSVSEWECVLSAPSSAGLGKLTPVVFAVMATDGKATGVIAIAPYSADGTVRAPVEGINVNADGVSGSMELLPAKGPALPTTFLLRRGAAGITGVWRGTGTNTWNGTVEGRFASTGNVTRLDVLMPGLFPRFKLYLTLAPTIWVGGLVRDGSWAPPFGGGVPSIRAIFPYHVRATGFADGVLCAEGPHEGASSYAIKYKPIRVPRAEGTVDANTVKARLTIEVPDLADETVKFAADIGLDGRRIGSLVEGQCSTESRNAVSGRWFGRVSDTKVAALPDPGLCCLFLGRPNREPLRLILSIRNGHVTDGVGLASESGRVLHEVNATGLSYVVKSEHVVSDSALVERLGSIEGSLVVQPASDPGVPSNQTGAATVRVQIHVLVGGQLRGVCSDSPAGELRNQVRGVLAPGDDTLQQLRAKWGLKGTLPPDPALSAKAVEAIRTPLFTAIPPTNSSWMTRAYCGFKDKQYVSAIWPPALDLTPVEGASHWEAKCGERAGVAVSPAEALAVFWADLPTKALHEVSFTPRSQDGSIPAGVGPQTRWVQRREPFTGPCVNIEASGRARILALARSILHYPPLAPFADDLLLSQTPAFGGKSANNEPPNSYAVVQAGLTLYRLSDDPAEAAEGLRRARAAGRWLWHRRQPQYGIWSWHWDELYQMTWAGLAFLRLYEVTHEDIWREACETFGKDLRALQQPNGAWRWGNGPELGGFARVVGYEFFHTAIFLRWFGQARLAGLTSFADVESRALDFDLQNGCRTFLWRDHPVYHSQHWRPLSAQNPSMLAVYLLECAEPARRDEALARKLLDFCEDRYVDWTRGGDGDPADVPRMTPRVCRGYGGVAYDGSTGIPRTPPMRRGSPARGTVLDNAATRWRPPRRRRWSASS